VDERDRSVRNATYRLFVGLGRAPTGEEVAAAEGSTPELVGLAWRRLHDSHALVLDPQDEIRMANPFSAISTAHRVKAAGRWWYANCAWDAFGICAALHADGDIQTSCPDCGDTLSVALRNQRVSDETLRFHCLVPASSWWDDIVFT
jgi:hypothetical protein